MKTVSLTIDDQKISAREGEKLLWVALAFFALGLVGHSGLEVIARAFYALHDTFTPVWGGSLAMALNLVLSLTLPGAFEVRHFGHWIHHL